MRTLIKFQDFVNKGIVRKQKPNKSRAQFLIEESENNYKFLLELLNKLSIVDDNANNFIKQCYDILMEIIRAKMLLDGYYSSGLGAHEAEVSYLRILGFEENEVEFLDQLRYFRNGMLYYGTILDKIYAKKVAEFTKRNYIILKKLVRAD